MLAVGILLGGTAGYFVFKYHEKAFALVAGGIAGFFIGEFLYNLFGNRIDANGTVINIVFVVASIIALVVLAYFFNKFIIIFSTSFIGSYCFIRGISLFGGDFPDEALHAETSPVSSHPCLGRPGPAVDVDMQPFLEGGFCNHYFETLNSCG